MPIPFNLTSLTLAFGEERGRQLEEKLLAAYGEEQKVGILELRQHPDPDLSQVADYIYEHVFLHYTMKQWGTTPEEIDPNTTARVPVYLSRDDRYFQDTYQGMPQEGYTPMFRKMLDHEAIDVQLGTPAETRLFLEDGKVFLDGEPFNGPVIYTGAVDELFSCQFGRLPYRTLDFQFETLEQEWFQTHGTVNYTVSEAYTRITEFKHLTGQAHPNKTTIVKEYSRAYDGASGTVPYYAVISPESKALYEAYQNLAGQYPQLHLLGRLAEYQYYNMDAITERALSLCDQLLTQ
jgi:UDP-galactopyranose mutase